MALVGPAQVLPPKPVETAALPKKVLPIKHIVVNVMMVLWAYLIFATAVSLAVFVALIMSFMSKENALCKDTDNVNKSISTMRTPLLQNVNSTESNSTITIEGNSTTIDHGIVAKSCSALLTSSPSGYYQIMASNESVLKAYCDMTRRCGNIPGGWMRVVHLNITRPSAECPPHLCLSPSDILCVHAGGATVGLGGRQFSR